MRNPAALFRLVGCTRGNTSVLFALMLPFIIGAAGFGAETSYWYYKHIRLQAAADQAAYAGAVMKRSGGAYASISASALQAATTNGFNGASGTITVNAPPASGSHQNDMAVEVMLDEPEARFFTAMFSSGTVMAHARAVASYERSNSNVCVLALSKNASGAVDFAGSSQMTLSGCSVMSDSIDPAAVTAQGSTQATVPCLFAVGGVQLSTGVTLTACSAPITQAPSLSDPYAGLTLPTVPGTCNANDNGATLSPGCYRGMSINGTTVLNPGVYIINGGTLKLNGNANLSGSGVTFYLTGGASISMNGNAVVNLTAPTSGAYAGMLFIDNPASAGSITFNGSASSHMTGTLYFPTQSVTYSGNFSGANGCTYIVANTVEWTGNATFSSDCSAYGMTAPVVHSVISVME